jgi:putative NIF3 family GTP cyclohydrolase 1 type 2
VKKLKCDLFITGDVKYHEALDAKELGISVLDIGHYESEHFFTDIIFNILNKVSYKPEIIVFNDKPIFKNM